MFENMTKQARVNAGFDAELDSIVVAEFEELMKQHPQKVKPARSRSSDLALEDKLHIHGETPEGDSVDLKFSEADQAFVNSSINFLKGRKDVDVVIEKIWQGILGDAQPAQINLNVAQSASPQTDTGDAIQ